MVRLSSESVIQQSRKIWKAGNAAEHEVPYSFFLVHTWYEGEEGGGLKFRANQPKILQGWRGKASFLVVISFEIYLPSLSDKAESCRCVRGVMDN